MPSKNSYSLVHSVILFAALLVVLVAPQKARATATFYERALFTANDCQGTPIRRDIGFLDSECVVRPITPSFKSQKFSCSEMKLDFFPEENCEGTPINGGSPTGECTHSPATTPGAPEGGYFGTSRCVEYSKDQVVKYTKGKACSPNKDEVTSIQMQEYIPVDGCFQMFLIGGGKASQKITFVTENVVNFTRYSPSEFCAGPSVTLTLDIGVCHSIVERNLDGTTTGVEYKLSFEKFSGSSSPSVASTGSTTSLLALTVSLVAFWMAIVCF